MSNTILKDSFTKITGIMFLSTIARNLSKYKLKGDPRFVIDIEYYELWITSKSIAI